MLPGGGHGDGLGLRPAGTAVGDSLPGSDARTGPRDVVGAVDGLARGGVAAVDRTVAAVGLHHRWGVPPDSVLPPGAPANERPLSSWPAAEVGVGDRLLSCVRIHLQNGGSVVFR